MVRYTLQQRINKAITTQDKSYLPVFCLIRDKVQCLVTHITKTVYVVVTKPDDKHAQEITKEEAQKLIELYDLIPQKETSQGAVYDTRDQLYRRQYRGFQVTLT